MVSTTKKISYTALLICMGLVLPQVFHAFGGAAAGRIFLPMHIPVLIAGLVLGAKYGVICGFLLPVISSMLTSMPSPAILPFMTVELMLYGLIAGLTNKLPAYVSLASALLIGRFVYFLALCFMFYICGFGGVPTPITVFTAISASFIGIIIQLVIVPPLSMALRRDTLSRKF